ncbi:hypothetical protein TKK_0006695 [Trichogramma kaykai]
MDLCQGARNMAPNVVVANILPWILGIIYINGRRDDNNYAAQQQQQQQPQQPSVAQWPSKKFGKVIAGRAAALAALKGRVRL